MADMEVMIHIRKEEGKSNSDKSSMHQWRPQTPVSSVVGH